MRIRTFVALFVLWPAISSFAQNVVIDKKNNTETNLSTKPISPETYIFNTALLEFDPTAQLPAVSSAMNREIDELIDSWPLAPLVVLLGISGETCTFTRPCDTFLVLSEAYSHLRNDVQRSVRDFLRTEFTRTPPFISSHYDGRQGTRREPHTLPLHILERNADKQEPESLLPIYATWSYGFRLNEIATVLDEWDTIQKILKEFLENPRYVEDFAKTPPEAIQVLNGDIAGLIAGWRLAGLANDRDMQIRIRPVLTELLYERIRYEHIDHRLIQESNRTTHNLHAANLFRYLDLTPELGRALYEHAEAAFKSHRNELNTKYPIWYMAWGERLIGGENFTNPPHCSSGVFSMFSFSTDARAEFLRSRIDVPWCPGDLWFIRKCTLALWVNSGRPWEYVDFKAVE